MARADRILVVDDDPDVRACVRMILEDEGYRVDEASDGFAALQAMRSERAGLLLLDYRMPGMSAAELLDIARGEALLECPVVLITASEDAGQDRRVRADGVLEKPFQLDDLLRSVAELTAR